MRLTRAAWRSRERRKGRVHRQAPAHSEKVDRSVVRLAAATALSVTAFVAIVIKPGGPLGWSYQVALLWLLVAAGAGRALLGFRRSAAAVGAQRPLLEAIPLWPAVVALAIAPYLHALSIGFLSDDFGIMSANKAAAGPLDILRFRPYVLFYRPLGELLWWSGLHIWGEAPLGYHLLNIALHAANSLLVYALGLRLTGSRYAALVAGALFAVHPLHVEPVVWSSCQPDLLAAGLNLVSLLCLEAFLAGGEPWKRRLALAAALTAFLLALLSKESSFGLPAVVVVRMLIAGGEGRWRRAVSVGGAYGALLGGYVAWRFSMLGEIGGYTVPLQFWNTLFPSTPLRQLGLFLFPIHRELFDEVASAALLGAAVVLMAAAVLWWIRGLGYIPSGRLWFYAGYMVLMSAPVWTISTAIGTNMQDSRFAYLPTVSLAWLFGDLCGGRGIEWRRGGAMALVVILLAAGLCVWYVVPWRQADALAREVLAAGRQVVADLPETDQTPVLFVQGLPASHFGAQVFGNGFEAALMETLDRPVLVQTVASRGASSGLTPELLELSVLSAGEYELTWRETTRSMEITRAGRAPIPEAKVAPQAIEGRLP